MRRCGAKTALDNRSGAFENAWASMIDGTMLVEHGPAIEDCTYANTSDDAVNVHGSTTTSSRKLGRRTTSSAPNGTTA